MSLTPVDRIIKSTALTGIHSIMQSLAEAQEELKTLAELFDDLPADQLDALNFNPDPVRAALLNNINTIETLFESVVISPDDTMGLVLKNESLDNLREMREQFA